MSNTKLLKQIGKPLPSPNGQKTHTPVILSDSKGKYLEKKVSNSIEKSIKWWIKSGDTCKKDFEWLETHLKSKHRRIGNIWLYVWLGTCDLTTKNKKYIALTANNDSAIDKASKYLEKIRDQVHKFPGCKVTFLEIPTYSIVEYNKHQGHKSPNDFKDQDKQLEDQVYKLNKKIRELNNSEEVHSPIFNLDLIKNAKTIKNKKTRNALKRKFFSFWLYIDGIHSGPNLSKVWLRKITIQLIKDCWSETA